MGPSFGAVVELEEQKLKTFLFYALKHDRWNEKNNLINVCCAKNEAFVGFTCQIIIIFEPKLLSWILFLYGAL